MEERRFKVYISGPITGEDLEQCRKRFRNLADKLSELDYEPVSPMDLPDWQPGGSWADYIIKDLQVLRNCDAILQMKGWHSSIGCHVEMDFALGMDIPIFQDYDLKTDIRQIWMRKQIEEYATRRNYES